MTATTRQHFNTKNMGNLKQILISQKLSFYRSQTVQGRSWMVLSRSLYR